MEGITKDWMDTDQRPDVEPADGAASGLHVDLWIRDQEVVDVLLAHTEGRARDDFARTALRIGVLALNQAQGRIDAEVVRREGERLITTLEGMLSTHGTQVNGTLSSYFNPQDGKVIERLERQNGDLERLMRSQGDAFINSLKQILDQFVGEGSTLSRLLTPGDSNQLLIAIGDAVNGLITAQRDRILFEFSLNNKDGAVSRLLGEVATKNGAFTDDVKGKVQSMMDELSLDKDGSALNRIRRELLGLIEKVLNDNNKFQQEVVAALEAMKARKAESFASTRHGIEFQAAALSFIERVSQDAGDILERTGERTGKIKHCKVGDGVLTVGPDCDAAGARVAVEVKEDESYDLKKSLAELAKARANRDASVGVFVHSRRTAPSGLKPLKRYGTDVVVVWDEEDEQSDVHLDAAISIAKALALRTKPISKASPVDVDVLDKAIREIERQAGFLEDIQKKAGTIKSAADGISDRAEQMRRALVTQIATLDQQALALRDFVG